MQGLSAILLRECLILRRKLWKLIASWAVSPLLYFMAFGWAGKDRVVEGGQGYAAFLLPGLAAMSAMIHSFAISSELNISRFYWKTFDEIRTAPVSGVAYVVGETLSGALRGLMAAAVVLLMGRAFNIPFYLGSSLIVALIITSLVFAALAISTAMLAKTHADQGQISSFVITPMAFLCGTFFPLADYPAYVRGIVKILPLTPATHLVRQAAWGHGLPLWEMVYLLELGALFLGLAIFVVNRTQD
jgi:ABC-2 type transport system permease protein